MCVPRCAVEKRGVIARACWCVRPIVVWNINGVVMVGRVCGAIVPLEMGRHFGHDGGGSVSIVFLLMLAL